MQLKLVSWNVNGLRAVAGKPEWEWFSRTEAQVVALQETKAHPDQLSEDVRDPDGWESHWSWSTVIKGYSGVAVFSRAAKISRACSRSSRVASCRSTPKALARSPVIAEAAGKSRVTPRASMAVPPKVSNLTVRRRSSRNSTSRSSSAPSAIHTHTGT